MNLRVVGSGQRCVRSFLFRTPLTDAQPPDLSCAGERNAKDADASHENATGMANAHIHLTDEFG